MSNHYFLAMKSNADSGLIKSIRYLTADEYANLAAKDANTLYLQDFGTSIPLSAATLEATADKLYWRASDTESSVLGSVSQSGDTITFTKYSKTSGSSAVTKGTTVISVPHWTSRLYLGDSTSSAAYLSVSSSPYIKLIENGALRDSIRFVQGTGILTSSDASGNLTTKIDYANALRRHVMSGSDALATIADTSITSYAYSSQPSDFPVANHSTIYTDRDVGTPYQIVVGDVSYYLWKKSLSGSTWTKMYSGYADHAAYVDNLSIAIPNNTNQLTNGANFAVLTDVVKYNDTLMNTNPFGGKHLYVNSMDNAMYAADKKWWVTGTLHKRVVDGVTYPYKDTSITDVNVNPYVDSPSVGDVDVSVLFDGSYESNITIPVDEYLVVDVKFSSDGATEFGGYPYGSYYISYYYNKIPDSAYLRVYNTYSPHTVGWKLYQFSDYNNGGSVNRIQILSDGGDFQRKELQFVIFSGSSVTAGPTQIDYRLDRPNLSRDGATVTKYGWQALYYDFVWYNNHAETVHISKSGVVTSPSFVGNLTGTASNASKLSNYPITSTGSNFGGVVVVGSDGVAEVGKYFDFHVTSSETSDYSVRLVAQSNSGNTVNLPVVSGTLPTIENANTWPASQTFGSQMVSTVATGTAPFSITSTTGVTNLNSDYVDGYHASNLWRCDGAVWDPGANVSLTPTANGQEWSFDIHRGSYTGCYWHVWDESLGTMLAVYPDDGHVEMPYGIVSKNIQNSISTESFTPANIYCTNGTSDNYIRKITASDFISKLGLITTSNIGSQNVNYASSAGYANKLLGSYTYNGGQQPPNYFGTNRIGGLMMNTTVNGNTDFKDFLIMDCYDGSDAGGAVAIGVDRSGLGGRRNISDKLSQVISQREADLKTDVGGASTYCRYFKIKFDNEDRPYLIAFGHLLQEAVRIPERLQLIWGLLFISFTELL
jgi:hypothetical protein